MILVDVNLLLYAYHPRAPEHEASRRWFEGALAGLAVEHGATLYTTDRDFSRFPSLKWANPLLGI